MYNKEKLDALMERTKVAHWKKDPAVHILLINDLSQAITELRERITIMAEAVQLHKKAEQEMAVKAAPWKASAEAAEKERDELRVKVERLKLLVNNAVLDGADATWQAEDAEKERDRWKELAFGRGDIHGKKDLVDPEIRKAAIEEAAVGIENYDMDDPAVEGRGVLAAAIRELK